MNLEQNFELHNITTIQLSGTNFDLTMIIWFWVIYKTEQWITKK